MVEEGKRWEEEEEDDGGVGVAVGRKAWTGVERRDRKMTTAPRRRRWWTPRGGSDISCCWCEGDGRLLSSSGPGPGISEWPAGQKQQVVQLACLERRDRSGQIYEAKPVCT